MLPHGPTTGFDFTLSGARLCALGAGALWWPAQRTLVVSDLHLGKSDRVSRRTGVFLPPYETRDTLDRLQALINDLNPQSVICLGDTFDDDTAARNLPQADRTKLQGMMQGRRWIWVEGNHDPSPPALAGEALAEFNTPPLTFRHVAAQGTTGEISGHYHPKASLRGQSRPAFLLDRNRLILPAFGTYTGGLRCTDPALTSVMEHNALAILTGPVPLPRPVNG
ncbi:ligase-associated DNA damage response endonuclease PdeM [Phaeobacter sp. B1627]|uniref:ligase-associated DNA damage response endonuclease PdeM n=1 Tax=Phaeobacter sp. B1627 TaxID=2583809 RepID=UPI001119015F|nr:ligase-associated DNA damage response endonuclease PdeM [Phaeobacter sp. B1627]TNJ42023.1 ligase-associated DNA damage response endonuclease PdeM [Phaeobacter sp. B1627]